MKRFFVFLGVVLATIGSAVRAQEVDSIAPLQMSSWGDAKKEVSDYIPDISLHTRMGYEHDFSERVGRFDGNGLYLGIDGKISPHFTYSFYHCIASSDDDGIFGFGKTQWLNVAYEHDWFSIKAGKDNVFVGSFEYDGYDIDNYYFMNSSFWNTFDCWQWGVSAAFYPDDDQENPYPEETADPSVHYRHGDHHCSDLRGHHLADAEAGPAEGHSHRADLDRAGAADLQLCHQPNRHGPPPVRGGRQ